MARRDKADKATNCSLYPPCTSVHSCEQIKSSLNVFSAASLDPINTFSFSRRCWLVGRQSRKSNWGIRRWWWSLYVCNNITGQQFSKHWQQRIKTGPRCPPDKKSWGLEYFRRACVWCQLYSKFWFKVPESIDMNGNFASELKSSKCKELTIEAKSKM